MTQTTKVSIFDTPEYWEKKAEHELAFAAEARRNRGQVDYIKICKQNAAEFRIHAARLREKVGAR